MLNCNDRAEVADAERCRAGIAPNHRRASCERMTYIVKHLTPRRRSRISPTLC